jgi:hypothetical protein
LRILEDSQEVLKEKLHDKPKNDCMFKNYKIYLTALITVFLSCKKSNSPSPAQMDASGTWSTSSLSNSTSGFSVSAAQYPCLASNKLILNKDGTLSQTYVGMDTCYMTINPLYILGIPGSSAPGTWSQNGDSVITHIQGIPKPGLGVISKTSTGYQLLIKDSVVNSIGVSVMIK